MFNHKNILYHYLVQALNQKAAVGEEESKQ